MRTLSTTEMNDVSGGCFGLLSLLFSFCEPKTPTKSSCDCTPAPKCDPKPAPKKGCY